MKIFEKLFAKKEKIEVVVIEDSGNPYLNAKEEWFERYGSFITQAKNWRLATLFCIVVAGISIFGNIIQATQIDVVPYIVEVDKLGRTSVVGKVEPFNIPHDRVIQSALSQVIMDWRTVTVDMQIQQNMMKRLSFFFAGSAKGVIAEWYRNSTNDPYEIAKSGRLISVEILSLPLKVAENTYRVEWSEYIRTHSGNLISRHNYQATIMVTIKPPTNEQVLLYNPAGIYLVNIDTAKIFESEVRQ